MKKLFLIAALLLCSGIIYGQMSIVNPGEKALSFNGNFSDNKGGQTYSYSASFTPSGYFNIGGGVSEWAGKREWLGLDFASTTYYGALSIMLWRDPAFLPFGLYVGSVGAYREVKLPIVEGYKFTANGATQEISVSVFRNIDITDFVRIQPTFSFIYWEGSIDYSYGKHYLMTDRGSGQNYSFWLSVVLNNKGNLRIDISPGITFSKNYTTASIGLRFINIIVPDAKKSAPDENKK